MNKVWWGPGGTPVRLAHAASVQLRQRIRTNSGLLRQICLYGGVSAVALLADVGTFRVLVHAGASPYLAAVLSFVVGVAVSYAGSMKLVFGRPGLRAGVGSFLSFALIGVAGVLISEAVIGISLTVVGCTAMNAKLMSVPPVFFFNFFARRSLMLTSVRTDVRAELGPADRVDMLPNLRAFGLTDLDGGA